MPRMPEIVGESEDAEPQHGENAVVEMDRKIQTTTCMRQRRPCKRGISVSPLRIRLNDFSGEGERAPPLVRRLGAGNKRSRKAEAPNFSADAVGWNGNVGQLYI